MERNKQADTIAKAMWSDSFGNATTDRGRRRLLQPLRLLLARLIDPQNDDAFVYGNTMRLEDSRITALLITNSHIYYANFKIRQAPNDEDAPDGERDGSYNLRIVPRKGITCITVDDIGTTDNGMADDVMRVDYTVHAHGFSFSIPIETEGRNQPREVELLETLHRDLAQK